MPVQPTLQDALRALGNKPDAKNAELWLNRVETLLDWIAHHPKLVEVRFEASRLLIDYRGGEAIPLAPNRRA